ncbi:MAG: YbaK/EbsC family protein [Candidatus Burarchaeum sp.]|nr:YbaK/EbsC family protein [Candidatus Burarchaeum sp.]MDO8339625.1 YbaK/EbsC family protein [Candidatus Burarchaeum sp.]
MNKIKRFIESNNVQCKLLEKPSTQETLKAHEVLKRLGYNVEPDQMIKALVCVPVVDEKYRTDNALLVMVSGVHRLSIKKLQRITGYKKIVIADQKTAEKLSGYPRGGTPPIAHDAKLTVVMDDELAKQSSLYGGGGTTECVLEITPPEISRVIKEIQKTEFIIADIRE